MKANAVSVYDMSILWRQIVMRLRNPENKTIELVHDVSEKPPGRSIFLSTDQLTDRTTVIREWLQHEGNVRSGYKMFGRFELTRGKYQIRVRFMGVIFVFHRPDDTEAFHSAWKGLLFSG